MAQPLDEPAHGNLKRGCFIWVHLKQRFTGAPDPYVSVSFAATLLFLALATRPQMWPLIEIRA